MKRSHLFLLVVFIISVNIVGCHKDDVTPIPVTAKAAKNYTGQKVRGYFNLLCTITKSTAGFFPPQAARAYGYVGITNYEAVVNGIEGAQSLGGQLNSLAASDLPKPVTGQVYNWAISSNAAMASIMRKMFGTNLSAVNGHSIDSMEQANLTEFSTSENADIVTRSVQFGKSVADAMYNYSKTDGGDQSYLDPFQLPFTVPADSFCWVPTSTMLHPVSPNWGNNRPFLAANINNTQPNAPLDFSSLPSSAFYREAMQVYNQVHNNNGMEQIEITKYWADDPFNTCTPTGHTFNILSQLLQENGATLEKTSVAYARMSIAENDAFISCWKGKYKYVLIRPVTYIRRYIDPGFNTVIGTPPFPAYTSGHSCEMGAGSRILINMFTDGSGNYQFSDYSQLQYGFQPRNYSNFNDLADECASSRFYGGIHFPMDNIKGLQVGRAIGDNVNHLINWPANVH